MDREENGSRGHCTIQSRNGSGQGQGDGSRDVPATEMSGWQIKTEPSQGQI